MTYPFRSRSLRFVASASQIHVGKGSRQIRSVTSGKGLALRAELFWALLDYTIVDSVCRTRTRARALVHPPWCAGVCLCVPQSREDYRVKVWLCGLWTLVCACVCVSVRVYARALALACVCPFPYGISN